MNLIIMFKGTSPRLCTVKSPKTMGKMGFPFASNGIELTSFFFLHKLEGFLLLFGVLFTSENKQIDHIMKN